jgi:hypothetical protein
MAAKLIGTSTPGKNDAPGGTAGPLSSGREFNYDLRMPFNDGKKAKQGRIIFQEPIKALYICNTFIYTLSMCQKYYQ